MSTFADLGHSDLAEDLDTEVDPLDVLGPVAPEPTPTAADPVGDWPTAWRRPARGWHVLDGHLVEFALEPDGGHAAAVPAAGWHEAMVARSGEITQRTRTTLPAPQVPAAEIAVADLTGPPAGLANLAVAAGYAVAASAAVGPLSVERSRCAACGVWERITDAGALTKHSSPGGACPGTELAEDRCATCGRKTRALKRGGLAKHDRLAVDCDNTAIDPDSPAWQQVASIVVRATTPGGHPLAVAYVDRGDGPKSVRAEIALAGDRRRPVGLDVLKACLRRVALCGAEAPAVPPADEGTPEPGTAGKSAPEVVLEPDSRDAEPAGAAQAVVSADPVVTPRDEGPVTEPEMVRSAYKSVPVGSALIAERGLFEYSSEAIEHVEERNCYKGCRWAIASSRDLPSLGCDLAEALSLGDGAVLEPLKVTPDGVVCEKFEPKRRAGAA